MRADRLVSLLMLLQRYGKLSACQLARRLEVSNRTIYRDMDALSAAGIPVYMERGVDGGCCLVEDYRTELTGLTQDEAQALFLLAVPGPLDEMAVGQKLQAALRKLFAALPDSSRTAAENSPRLHLDWTPWKQVRSTAVPLDLLYQAITGCRRVLLAYRLWSGIFIEQEADPLGLVAKAGEWHLVCNMQDRLRRWRLGQLESVSLLSETFVYPQDFDLTSYWRGVVADVDAERLAYPVKVRVRREFAGWLEKRFAQNAVRTVAQSPGEEDVIVEMAFSMLESAREQLLPLGGAVEVLAPEALRLSMLDFARQISRRYHKENDDVV